MHKVCMFCSGWKYNFLVMFLPTLGLFQYTLNNPFFMYSGAKPIKMFACIVLIYAVMRIVNAIWFLHIVPIVHAKMSGT